MKHRGKEGAHGDILHSDTHSGSFAKWDEETVLLRGGMEPV